MSFQSKCQGGMKSKCFVPAAFACILLVACFAVAGLAWQFLIRSRAQHQRRAETTAQNLCMALSGNLITSYEKIDLAIYGVKEEVEHQLASGPIDEPGLEKFMQRHRSRVPVLYALRIVNADGIVQYGDVPAGPRVNLADRDYFIRLKANPQAGLVFSKPLMGRVNAIWTIMLARRINRPDGSFWGIVYGALELNKLGAQFASLSIGREGIVSLRDADLLLIARQGGLQELPGQSMILPEFRTLLQTGRADGAYTSMASADKVERIYAFTRLKPYGHYLSVGLGVHEVFEPWRTELHQTLGFMALFLLLLGASAWMAYRSWLVQQRDAEGLKAREALLAEANQLLVELNQQKNQFLGIVAHDLRNPLNGIILATQLLEEEEDLGMIHGIARKMHGEGLDMSSLVGRFLDLAQIDSGKMEAQPELFDPAALVRHVAERHLPRSQEKDITFAYRLQEAGAEAYGDPKLSKQVLDNLISNALKFSPPGTTVTLRVDGGADEVVVSVEDQGPGLTDGDKARLFGRFASLSAQPTGGEKSTGLGLSIVKPMVEAMGGRIWVDSTPGLGAAFRVALRRTPPNPTP